LIAGSRERQWQRRCDPQLIKRCHGIFFDNSLAACCHQTIACCLCMQQAASFGHNATQETDHCNCEIRCHLMPFQKRGQASAQQQLLENHSLKQVTAFLIACSLYMQTRSGSCSIFSSLQHQHRHFTCQEVAVLLQFLIAASCSICRCWNLLHLLSLMPGLLVAVSWHNIR